MCNSFSGASRTSRERHGYWIKKAGCRKVDTFLILYSASVLNMRKCAVEVVAVLLVVGTVAGCGGGDSSSPTAPTQTGTVSAGNTGMTVHGISLV